MSIMSGFAPLYPIYNIALDKALAVLLIIFGIGAFVYSQRTAKEPAPVAPSETDVPIPIPQLRTKRSVSGGHFHADGSFHANASHPAIGTHNRSMSQNGGVANDPSQDND